MAGGARRRHWGQLAGETALHDACLHGSLPTIEWLLTMPQPATSTGGEGQAVPRSVEELINKRTQQGITPLALAALGGHTEVARADRQGRQQGFRR